MIFFIIIKIVLEHETLYTDALPSASMYERSFMHRDVLTHAVVTRKDFVITVSADGQLKFWKKMGEGIEFVKHYKSHLGLSHSFVCVSWKSSATILSDMGIYLLQLQ